MDRKISLIPFTRTVVTKTIEHGDFSESERKVIAKIQNKVDDVILSNDDEMTKELRELVNHLQPEPPWAVGIRALIRPTMTLVLTIVFVILVLGQAGLISGDRQPDDEVYKEVFTVFLAIYGPIIGFWFGERKAEKKLAS